MLNHSIANYKFHIVISLLIAVASYETFLRLLSVTGGHEAQGISIGGVLFVVTSLLLGIYAYANSSLLKGAYVNIIISYSLCFIILCLIRDRASSIYIISNVLWCLAAIGGYIIGKKNCSSNSSSVAVKWISVPLVILLASAIPQTFKFISMSEVSDCFFICSIFIPLCVLIKPKNLRILILVFLISLCIISLKRTLIITSLLTIVLYLYHMKGAQSYMIKTIILVLILLSTAIFFQLDETLMGSILSRFQSISEDGGSGRNEIYQKIMHDIWWNFSTMDVLFGKGHSSVSRLLGLNAHSDVLQLLHSFGITALFIYLMLTIHMIKTQYRYSHMVKHNSDLILASSVSILNFILKSATYRV